MRVIDFFDNSVASYADRAAVIQDGRSLTYRELDSWSRKIAAAIHARGPSDGARIAVYSPNDIGAFACIIAALRVGAVWVPVNARNPLESSIAYLEATGCSWLFYHPAFAADIAEIRRRVPSLRFAVCMGEREPGELSLDSLLAEGHSALPDLSDDPDRPATIFATGGTTGRSKGALWTYRTWETMLANWWSTMRAPTPPVHLVVAPMTHGAGVLAIVMAARGATNVILDRPSPREICEAIARHGVTDVFLPPTIVYMMLAEHDVRRHDYGTLRHIVYGAAPMSVDKLTEAMDVFGRVMTQIYGQAEAPMICSCLLPHEHPDPADPALRHRLASCGRPTLFTRVEIMDDDGKLLANGERGEIVVRSHLVMQEYFEDPVATEEARRHGWHHTGDVGLKDADGFLYVVDRKKDMIITGGFNVFSTEVEQVIFGLEDVQDCAVIGVPDAKWGEAVKAVIELKAGTKLDEQEVLRHCREKLGAVKTPKSVEFRASLPRSPNGKVLKREIRAPYWAGRERTI